MALILATVLSAVRSTVLPRAAQSRIAGGSVRAVRAMFRLRTHRASSYEDRDRATAMLGPVAALGMLATWLLLIAAGYVLIYLGVTRGSLARCIELSGSSIFTLGTTSDRRLGPSVLTYSEAGLGLLILALLITYLPSIYNAFARRETGVSLLQVRAGSPPRGVSMLIRYHRIEERLSELTELWRQWEAWFADIEESHTTFPILCYFRSPQPERSWITAAGALLDGASFWVACVEHGVDADAQLCIRAGYLALRRIADTLGVIYPPDPSPGDPITIDRFEWDGAMAEMESAGIPLRADRELAWRDWRGWRVNYDAVLLRLARLVEAPPAPWVSDRSPNAVLLGEPPPGRGPSGRTATGRSRWRARSR